MASVYEVVQLWEKVVARWRGGDDTLPEPLQRWRDS